LGAAACPHPEMTVVIRTSARTNESVFFIVFPPSTVFWF
jgi:hypothetical protein